MFNRHCLKINITKYFTVYLPINLLVILKTNHCPSIYRNIPTEMSVLIALWKIILVFACLLRCSTSTHKKFTESVVAGVNFYPGEESTEALILMNSLAIKSAPKCLKIVILSSRHIIPTSQTKPQEKQMNKSQMEKFTSEELESQVHIVINANPFNQAEKTLKTIHSKITTISWYSCVTYMVAVAADSHLLAALMSLHSKIRLRKFFLFHTDNLKAAEKVLLDPLLIEEENVAAVIRHDSNTLWAVLTRQLFHPLGSPQIQRANTWSRDTGFTNTQHIFPDQMKNFYGKKLIGSALQFRPYVIFDEVEGSRVVRPKPSLDLFLVDSISQQLNFTYDIVKPEDGQWGYIMENVSSVCFSCITQERC